MSLPRKRKAILLKSLKSQRPAESPTRVDVEPSGSTHRGIAGLYEKALRRFKGVVYGATMIPLYGLGVALVGFALAPGITLVRVVAELTREWTFIGQSFAIGCALAGGFFLFGFILLFAVPFMNFALRVSPKVFRGPYYSVNFMRWFIHNALTYLVRYTVLEFITPTPFNLMFFRLMGMKIGAGTQINTSNISDPGLIELGRNVTIGGSVTLCAHYGQRGFLILAPVKIGDGVTIGLKASVMGGVEIGEKAMILPHSVVLPKTKIGAGETWGGVPAQKIENMRKLSRAS